MKIINIEFENINSLKGEWKIDFTDSSYKKNHDIFVICGPTGSGKTSILDAITLGLYGRTPRQQKLTSDNEVMTRGTNSCFASVTFETENGIFTSKFSQKRKSDGRFAEANCSILKSDGEIIMSSGKITPFAKKMEEIIELKYEQFCQSIMLAQGEFSKFINSESRERAAILSKLNGTDKYKKIGEKVHEEYKKQKQNFEFLKEKKQGLEEYLVSEEDEKKLNLSIKKIKKQLEEFKIKDSEFDKKLNILESLQKLEENFNQNKIKIEGIQNKQLEINNFDEKLKKAKVANEIKVDYEIYKNSKKLKEENSNKIQTISENILKTEQELNKTQNNLDIQTEIFKKLEEEYKFSVKLWDEVLKVDSEIELLSKNKISQEKLKIDSENEYSKVKNKVEELLNSVKNLIDELKKSSEFLKQNENLKSTAKILPDLIHSNEEILSLSNKNIQIQKDLNISETELKNLQKKLKEFESKKDEVELNLKNFISQEFLIIADELKKTLKPNNPCPVCGSVEHPFQTSKNSENFETSEKNTKVVSKTVDFSKQIQDLKNTVSELNNQISSVNSKIEQQQILLNQNKEEISVKTEYFFIQLNKIYPGLNGEIPEILTELKNKVQKFQVQSDSFEEKNTELQLLKQNLENYTVQQTQKKEFFEKMVSDFEKTNKNFNLKSQERINLFQNKNVQEERAAFDEKLSVNKENLQLLQNQATTYKSNFENLTQNKIQLLQEEKKLTSELDENSEKFNKNLKNHGFVNEIQFENAILPENEYKKLDNLIKEFETEKVKVQTSFENSKTDLEKFNQNNKIEYSKDELLLHKQEIQSSSDKISEELIQLNSKLLQNTQNQKDYSEILQKYNEQTKVYTFWEKMKNIVGIADGSDLLLFVEGIVFKNLLKIANQYLQGITNRFELVQKSDFSMDFLIKDVNFAENRPISNLSGGEKFIISLCLALGISKFASKKIKVDCLFLDEGFGTLSGTYLTESINALKRLSSENKMLGIITHVESVINEFPQKIIVKQSVGGSSVLIGSGITPQILE